MHAWQHEYRSAEILEELLDDSKFWDLPELPEKFTREDLDFIQGMITFSEDLSMIEKQQGGDCTSVDDRRKKGMQVIYIQIIISRMHYNYYAYLSEYAYRIHTRLALCRKLLKS